MSFTEPSGGGAVPQRDGDEANRLRDLAAGLRAEAKQLEETAELIDQIYAETRLEGMPPASPLAAEPSRRSTAADPAA